MVGASKDEVVEDGCEMLRLVSSAREPRALPGSRGGAPTAALVRSSSRGPGAIRIPSFGGEERVKPTVSTVRPSSRGPGAIRTPGSRGEKYVIPAVSTLRPSSRGPGAIRVPGSRGEEATPASGAQWSVPESDVLPVSTIGGIGSANVPPLGSQLVRKFPGWRPLGLMFGTDT